MPLDYKGADAQEIAERLKGLAVRFIVAVNESGFFVPVAGQINYRVAFDKMDANLCIVTLSLTLQEQAGVCFDYGFCSTRNRHATVAVATFSPTPRRVGLSVRPEMVYRHHRGLGRNKGCRYFSVGSSDQNNDGGVGPIP